MYNWGDIIIFPQLLYGLIGTKGFVRFIKIFCERNVKINGNYN